MVSSSHEHKGGGMSSTNNNTSKNGLQQINDLKRKPSYSAVGGNEPAPNNKLLGGANPPYRRISAQSNSSYYGRQGGKSYYNNGNISNESEREPQKRSFSGGRPSSKPYYETSEKSSDFNSQLSQSQESQGPQRSSSLPSFKDNSNYNPSMESVPSTNTNTDQRNGLEKPLSSGAKTPRGNSFHPGSSYTNPRFSNYGIPRKYYGNKYLSTANSSIEKNGSNPHSAGSNDHKDTSSTSEAGDSSHNGDSYYPVGSSYPYGKSYKQSNRQYFGKPMKQEYYSNQDSFYNSKYESNKYYHSGNGYSNYNSYGKHLKGSYGGYSNPNNTPVSLNPNSSVNLNVSNYDDDYSGCKNGRPRKYNGWYSNNPATPATKDGNSSSLASSPTVEFSESKDDDRALDDSVKGESSLTKTEYLHKSIDKSLFVGKSIEKKPTLLMVDTKKDDSQDEGDDDEQSDAPSSALNSKGSLKVKDEKLNQEKKLDEDEIEEDADEEDIDEEEDGYNLDSDIEVHFDDDDDDEEDDEKIDSAKDTRASTPFGKESFVKNLDTLKDKSSSPEFGKPQTATSKKSKASKSVPKQHKKIYIDIGEGCVFPLNYLEQKLFDLKNRPREEIVQHQEFLLKKPIKNLNEYQFFSDNVLINEQSVKTKLLDVFKTTKRRVYFNNLLFKKEYEELYSKWESKCEMNEKQLVEIYPDYKSQLFNSEFKDQEIAAPEERSSFGRRSRNYIADSVTSEAEFEKILQQIKMNDPLYKAEQHAATIPEMILDPVERFTKHFIDVNNLVLDKSVFSRRLVTDTVLTFNKEEQELFNEAYINNPKKFGRISQAMGGLRRPGECVRHYYNSKRAIHYKQLVANKRNRKAGTRKRSAKPKLVPKNKGDNNTNGVIDDKQVKVNEQESTSKKENDEVKLKPKTKRTASETSSESSVKSAKSTKQVTLESDVPNKKQKIEVKKKSPTPTIVQLPSADSVINDNNPEKLPQLPPSVPIKQLLPSTMSIKTGRFSKPEDSVTFKERKTKPVSSYWSVVEIGLFPNLLQKYGTQWDLIAKEMGTKTTIMVRNYFAKNADKENWREMAERIDRERQNSSYSVVSIKPPTFNVNNQYQQLKPVPSEAPPLGYFVEKAPTGYFNNISTGVNLQSQNNSVANSGLPPLAPMTANNTAVLPSSVKEENNAPPALATFYNRKPMSVDASPETRKSTAIHNLVNDDKGYQSKGSNIKSVLNSSSNPQESNFTALPRMNISSIVNIPGSTIDSTNSYQVRSGSPFSKPLTSSQASVSSSKGPSIMNLLNSSASSVNAANNSPPVATLPSSNIVNTNLPSPHSSNIQPISRGSTPVNLPPLSKFTNNNFQSSYDTSRQLLSFASSGNRSILNHNSEIRPSPPPALVTLPSSNSPVQRQTYPNSSEAKDSNWNEGRQLPSLNSVLHIDYQSRPPIATAQSGFDTLIAAANASRQQQQQTSEQRHGSDLSEYHYSNKGQQ